MGTARDRPELRPEEVKLGKKNKHNGSELLHEHRGDELQHDARRRKGGKLTFEATRTGLSTVGVSQPQVKETILIDDAHFDENNTIVDDLNRKNMIYVTRQSTKYDFAPILNVRQKRLVNTASWGEAVTGAPPEGEC